MLVLPISAKKPDASEAEIRLNEGRFERLLRRLRSISKQLKAQLQRKTLLLGGRRRMSPADSFYSHLKVVSLVLVNRKISFS